MKNILQLRKQQLIWMILLITMIFIVSCTPSGGSPGSIQETMFVGPAMVECTGMGSQECLQVKFNRDDAWELFYDKISGFDFEPGYEYELLINKTEIENPPADKSLLEYSLVAIVSKTAVSDDEDQVGLANPASVYCEEQGGRVEIRTDANGNQYGVCVFEDGSECEEWAFFRGECQPGETAGSSEETDMSLLDKLVDIDWVLVKLGAQFPIEGSAATLRFTVDGLNGSAGCNRFFGSYTLDGSSFMVGQMGSTEMWCEGFMDQEQQLLRMLSIADSLTVDQEKLVIHTAKGDIVYQPSVVEPLEGTNWVLSGIAQFGGVVHTMIDDEITAVFQDGQMSGSAGCNNYFASYTLDGTSLSLGPVGSTRMMCDDERNQREMEFLTALANVTGYDIQMGSLTLVDADGNPFVQFQIQK